MHQLYTEKNLILTKQCQTVKDVDMTLSSIGADSVTLLEIMADAGMLHWGGQGWQWVDEAKEGAQQAKWGMVSSQVGDELVLRIGGSSRPAQPHNSSVLVGLGMLKSYQDVGAATVSCSRGCSCKPDHFQLLHDQQVSLPIETQNSMASSCSAGKSCHILMPGLDITAALFSACQCFPCL